MRYSLLKPSLLSLPRHLVLLLALLSLKVSGQAQVSLPLDPKLSSVKFVGESFLHNFHGEAKNPSGSAELEPESVPPIQKAHLLFKTAALTTFHTTRDKEMYDWMKVDVHPKAEFVLEKVTRQEGDYKTADAQHPAKFLVVGSLTLNETKQAVTGSALGWREGNRVVITGVTVVDTMKAGLPMIKKSFLTVGKDIQVEYRLAFILPPEYAAH